MKMPAHFFWVLAFTSFWAGQAWALSVPIDDSGSVALEPTVAMRWRDAVPRPGSGNLMVGTTKVRIHLNVLPWLHRTARIYLSLPMQRPGPLHLSWTTQGRLREGEVQSGQRVLVYAGPITTAFLEDVFQFQFTLNGTLLPRTTPVSFNFEMDEG
jgi:hypothetical protein